MLDFVLSRLHNEVGLKGKACLKLKATALQGGHRDWVELVRWDVPIGYTGDLHTISLLSNNDEKTRYRIFLANVDQGIPTDRQTRRSTSGTAPFYQVDQRYG